MTEHNSGDQALSDYEALDLGEGSALRRSLLDKADDEAASRDIRLSDCWNEKNPAFLTGEMLSWYRTEISPARQRALNAVGAAFSAIGAEGKKDTVFLEKERQVQRIKLQNRKRDIMREQREGRRADFVKLTALRNEEEQLRHEYNSIRAREKNREPQMLNFPLYVILLFFIGIVEIFINYDSFRSLSWSTPFLALGMSIVVAIALALASHWHGTVLKQWDYYFGRRERDTHRFTAWRMLCLGTLALTLVLSSVVYARWSFLGDYLDMRDTFGEGADGVSAFMVVGGSVLGNVLVWIVGIFIAWLLHDRNPEFPEKRKALRRKEVQAARIADSLEKERKREFERAEAAYSDEIERLENADKAQAPAGSYQTARTLYDRFCAQDGKLLAALFAYRSQLIRQSNGGESRILVPANDDPDDLRSYPLGDYVKFDPELRLM
jgi:hypothetical protein